MRINVVSGDRSVYIKVKGNSPKRLARAEAVAHRLLTAAPVPTPPAPSFGFTITSDHEPADPPE